MAIDREPIPQLWLHFPSVKGKGCEGVLIFHSSDRCDRILLVDGSADQIDDILRWSKLRYEARSGKQLEITWVVSHYHRDHMGQGHRLLGGSAEKYLVEVCCPSGLYSSWPEECEKALAELGPKIERLRTICDAKSSRRPQVCLPKLGKLENLWDCDRIRIGAFGGPHRNQVPKAVHARENARSLIVIGVAEEWRKGTHPPFTFVLPGDAEEVTWNLFKEVLEIQNNIMRNLPLALLKLSHHGSLPSNPKHALEWLLGERRHRKNQLIVRIRNAIVEPRRAVELETTLQHMQLTMHDTRKEGDLWVRLRRGEPLVRATHKADPGLDLPACFRS